MAKSENAIYSAVSPFRRRVGQDPGGPSMTRQEFAEECDVNVLMERYEKVGGMFPANPAEPRYLDLTEVPDFQASMQMLIDAENAFMSLPAKVRREFDNDPAKFVEFAQDPENIDQLRAWDMAPPAPVEAPPMRVEVVNPGEAEARAGDAPIENALPPEGHKPKK